MDHRKWVWDAGDVTWVHEAPGYTPSGRRARPIMTPEIADQLEENIRRIEAGEMLLDGSSPYPVKDGVPAHTVVGIAQDAWNEAKHHRGQPDNKGKFAKGGSASASTGKSSPPLGKCPEDQNTCMVWSIAHAIDKPVDEVWQHAKPFWNKRTGISGAAKDDILEKFGYELGDVRRDVMYHNPDSKPDERSRRTLSD
jgi:hypothetical protein